MHPVVRAAFKAVELLIKWLEGSTPSSSAKFRFIKLHWISLSLPKVLFLSTVLFIQCFRRLLVWIILFGDDAGTGELYGRRKVIERGRLYKRLR